MNGRAHTRRNILISQSSEGGGGEQTAQPATDRGREARRRRQHGPGADKAQEHGQAQARQDGKPPHISSQQRGDQTTGRQGRQRDRQAASSRHARSHKQARDGVDNTNRETMDRRQSRARRGRSTPVRTQQPHKKIQKNADRGCIDARRTPDALQRRYPELSKFSTAVKARRTGVRLDTKHCTLPLSPTDPNPTLGGYCHIDCTFEFIWDVNS